MRSAVTLYEFMPYGAPELLESRQRDMSRALILTSLLALVVCALAGSLASRIPVAPIERDEVAVGPIRIVTPPPLVDVRLPAAPPVRVQAKTPASGDFKPIDDELVIPTEPPVSVGPDGAETDPIGAIPPGGSATIATVGESLPARGTWVYVEQEPAPIKEVKPEYPPIAEQAGVEGLVMVQVLVGRDGRVLDAVLAEKIQVPMLNQAALEAARQWVFTPGYANGHPVACWTAIPFRFRLH